MFLQVKTLKKWGKKFLVRGQTEFLMTKTAGHLKNELCKEILTASLFHRVLMLM